MKTKLYKALAVLENIAEESGLYDEQAKRANDAIATLKAFIKKVK